MQIVTIDAALQMGKRHGLGAPTAAIATHQMNRGTDCRQHKGPTKSKASALGESEIHRVHHPELRMGKQGGFALKARLLTRSATGLADHNFCRNS
ncbi:MAG: hypothetical protein ACKVP1_18195 [Burkholderiaceae bacterium]